MNSDTHGVSRRAPPKTRIYIDTHDISNNGRGSGFQMQLEYHTYDIIGMILTMIS